MAQKKEVASQEVSNELSDVRRKYPNAASVSQGFDAAGNPVLKVMKMGNVPSKDAMKDPNVRFAQRRKGRAK